MPRPMYPTYNPQVSLGTNMQTVVDMTIRVDNETKEFCVPSNLSVHTYGDYTLSENKEAMISEVDGLLQNSKDILDSVDKHKASVTAYESILKKLNPVYAKEQERDQPDHLMADNRPDEKMNQERDVIADFEADEAFLNLSALVTRFFEERDRRSGTQKGFRYYKAVYTQGIFDYLKDGLENPPEFQHEVDIIRAADEAFANFVTLHHPYSDKEPLEIRKIFFNDLEYNRAVAPSYVKNVYPDEVIAIPMKPFVIGGYMERVHHMQVSASLVSQQMNRYERDAAEVLHRIGIESKRYKEKTEEKDD